MSTKSLVKIWFMRVAAFAIPIGIPVWIAMLFISETWQQVSIILLSVACFGLFGGLITILVLVGLLNLGANIWEAADRVRDKDCVPAVAHVSNEGYGFFADQAKRSDEHWSIACDRAVAEAKAKAISAQNRFESRRFHNKDQ